MKKNLSSLALFLCISNFVFSQADLVVSASSFTPNSIAKGGTMQVQATVKNVGNATAAANFMYVYFTQDQSVSDDEIVSRVSIQELGPGQSQAVDFRYPVSPLLFAGSYHVAFKVDPLGQIPESNENNAFCVKSGSNCSTFNLTNSVVASQKFAYPVLFVHGWTGNSHTWTEFSVEAEFRYGWSFGGRLDYCLNPDGNQYTSDGIIKSFVNTANLSEGDYYLMNFDVGTNGALFVSDDGIPFNDDYSNQSAIVKQGWAVSDAVKKILAKTGAEMVILVGHSMGGLASREYLQNPGNWQADGEHHVAKLLTIGTPNGGSNMTGAGLGIFAGYDESSEAVRDLRYESVIFDGQYLDGGFEDNFSIFYNNDVDCNGAVGGLITGLNEKTAPSEISYSCIVGVGNNLPGLDGDGIVADERADLNNYLVAQPPLGQLDAERFDVTTAHTDMHKENPNAIVRGLDEADEYYLAYPIPFNAFQYGWCTQQAPNSPYEEDYDDYRLSIPTNGLLEVNVYDIPVNEFGVFLLKSNYDPLKEVVSEGKSNLSFSIQVAAGTYYLEAAGIPTPNSWKFPYALEVKFTPSNPSAVEDAVAANGLSLFPNPTSGDFEVQWSSLELGEYEIAVVNSMGQVVRRSVHQKTGELGAFSVSLDGLPSGAYFVQLNSAMELRVGMVVKE